MVVIFLFMDIALSPGNLEIFSLSKYKKNIKLEIKIRILLTLYLMCQKLGKFLCRKVYFHLKKLRKEILDRS